MVDGEQSVITYKDKAWCSERECGNKNCSRNYTEVEAALNERTVDLPLSQMSFKSEDCGYEQLRLREGDGSGPAA